MSNIKTPTVFVRDFFKVMKTFEQWALSREAEWAHAHHQQAAPLPNPWCMKLRPGSCNRHIHIMGLCLETKVVVYVLHSGEELSIDV